jgi:FKBP-type peptidyl-prolyl cis-trans isomerase FklB
MRCASASDKVKADGAATAPSNANPSRQRQLCLTTNKRRGRLDARRLSTSVQASATKAQFALPMKSLSIAIIALTFVTAVSAEEKPALKDSKDKVSYSIGLDIGSTLKKQNIDVNADVLSTGLKDALSGAKPQLTEEQIKETMTTFSKELTDKQQAKMQEAAQKNATEGEKFLAENKTKPGVKTTASGLQYKVMKEGNGPSPKETDTVVTNYRGTLINGTEFDSSYKRNEPVTFPVNGVIKGWTEALQLMKKGAKYQLFVPAGLAYGPRGAGQEIGPNATLIFEVELVDIKPAPSASAPPATTPAATTSPTASRKP